MRIMYRVLLILSELYAWRIFKKHRYAKLNGLEKDVDAKLLECHIGPLDLLCESLVVRYM